MNEKSWWGVYKELKTEIKEELKIEKKEGCS